MTIYSHRTTMRALKLAGALSALGTTLACSLQNFDYLQRSEAEGSNGGSAHAGNSPGGSGNGGTSGASGTSSTAGGGGEITGEGGAGEGATGAGGAPEGGANGGITGTAGTGGMPAVAGPWSFDAEQEVADWQPASFGVSVAWVEDGQDIPLGAMNMNFSAETEVQHSPTLPLDLQGHTLSARLRTESGTANVKLYAMSNGWLWADGGENPIDQEWRTITFHFSAPSFESPGYDATQIVRFGVHASAVSVVLLDSLWLD